MLRSLLMIFVFVSPCLTWASDPNLTSYKNAGECSDSATGNSCGECPLKKNKKITLPANSSASTPNSEADGNEDSGTQSVEGVN